MIVLGSRGSLSPDENTSRYYLRNVVENGSLAIESRDLDGDLSGISHLRQVVELDGELLPRKFPPVYLFTGSLYNLSGSSIYLFALYVGVLLFGAMHAVADEVVKDLKVYPLKTIIPVVMVPSLFLYIYRFNFVNIYISVFLLFLYPLLIRPVSKWKRFDAIFFVLLTVLVVVTRYNYLLFIVGLAAVQFITPAVKALWDRRFNRQNFEKPFYLGVAVGISLLLMFGLHSDLYGRWNRTGYTYSEYVQNLATVEELEINGVEFEVEDRTLANNLKSNLLGENGSALTWLRNTSQVVWVSLSFVLVALLYYRPKIEYEMLFSLVLGFAILSFYHVSNSIPLQVSYSHSYVRYLQPATLLLTLEAFRRIYISREIYRGSYFVLVAIMCLGLLGQWRLGVLTLRQDFTNVEVNVDRRVAINSLNFSEGIFVTNSADKLIDDIDSNLYVKKLEEEDVLSSIKSAREQGYTVYYLKHDLFPLLTPQNQFQLLIDSNRLVIEGQEIYYLEEL